MTDPAERERCAKVADELAIEHWSRGERARAAGDRGHWIMCLAQQWACEEVARAIRGDVQTSPDKKD